MELQKNENVSKLEIFSVILLIVTMILFLIGFVGVIFFGKSPWCNFWLSCSAMAGFVLWVLITYMGIKQLQENRNSK